MPEKDKIGRIIVKTPYSVILYFLFAILIACIIITGNSKQETEIQVSNPVEVIEVSQYQTAYEGQWAAECWTNGYDTLRGLPFPLHNRLTSTLPGQQLAPDEHTISATVIVVHSDETNTTTTNHTGIKAKLKNRSSLKTSEDPFSTKRSVRPSDSVRSGMLLSPHIGWEGDIHDIMIVRNSKGETITPEEGSYTVKVAIYIPNSPALVMMQPFEVRVTGWEERVNRL